MEGYSIEKITKERAKDKVKEGKETKETKETKVTKEAEEKLVKKQKINPLSCSQKRSYFTSTKVNSFKDNSIDNLLEEKSVEINRDINRKINLNGLVFNKLNDEL